jgi:hypothetical protein
MRYSITILIEYKQILWYSFYFFFDKRDLLKSKPSKYNDKNRKVQRKEEGKNLTLKKRKETNRTYNKAFPNDSYQNHLTAGGEYNPTM